MKRYNVRFTARAEEDLVRLYEFLLDRDVDAAERALHAIHAAVEVPAFRRFHAAADKPFLRELIVPFGTSGTWRCSKSSPATL